MGSEYRDIIHAPRDGTVIRLSGIRFKSTRRYYVDAMWDTRNCPMRGAGWFPPDRDDEGPYHNPDKWKPIKHVRANGDSNDPC